MRDTKFRGWDTVGKRFLRYFFVDSEGNVWKDSDPYGAQMSGKRSVYMATGIILSEYTGLKDKNGKEIYEGDIVKWGHVEGGKETPIRIAEVKINPDLQFHILNHTKVFKFGSFIYTDTEKWLEVIGNIYETPTPLSGTTPLSDVNSVSSSEK